MIEKTYSFHQSDEKMIEQIVDDDNLVKSSPYLCVISSATFL